ncbi:DMT family transporter [Niveispirillum sp. KHB5.9]|uniref:DMT family transporter n=1 Tax=Niveispirillum sp. KHB5.9 TaxID=3400269 RepID=UPI003A896BEA
MSHRPSPFSWFLLLAASPLLFGSNVLAARFVAGEIPAVAMAFWRWALALLFLAPFIWNELVAGWPEFRRDWRGFLLLGSLGMGICGAPVYLAGQTTTATNISLIYAAAPVLIVLYGRLFWREKVSAVQALGVAISLSGVVAVIAKGDPRALLHLHFTAGDLWIVLAANGWAFYSLLLRHRASGLTPFARFSGICAGGVVSMLPFYALEMAAGQVADLSVRTVATLVFLAIIPGLASYLVYGRLVTVFGAGRAGMVLYLTPLYNAALAALLLGERLEPYHLLGIALVLPGIWLATRRPAQ